MNRKILALLCLLAGVLASHASAQIADFSDTGLFGGRNLTQHTMGEFAWQANQIENDRFVVTAWPQLAGANVSYFWQTYDKTTGVINGPNQIQNASASGAAFNIQTPSSLRHLRPALCFTTAPSGDVNAYQGIAIGLTQLQMPANVNDVMLHFLRLDPASLPPTGTQPVWIYDTQRIATNVSASAGNADSPSVICLDNGQMAVTWRDTSTVGMIGGQSLINPQVPAPNNPGGLNPMDIYARRLQQQFDPINPILGAADGAVPASTRNLSNSLGQDVFPNTATNGLNTVYTVWQTLSGVTDDVAGRGPGSGPLNGGYGNESTEIYGRSLTLPTSNLELTLNAGVNLTSSTGTSNLPPAIAYNRTLNQLGVVFLDNSPSGGIAGKSNLAATPKGPVSNQVNVDDVFFAIYNSSFTQTQAVAVTQSPNIDVLANIASLDAGGWLVAWGEYISTAPMDIRSRMISLDGVALAQSAPRQYPVQSVVQSGNPQPVWLFAMTARTPSTINLAFSMAGTPDDLKAGQPVALTGNQDLFLASGKPTSSGVVNGQVQIIKFQINDAQPIDPATPPSTVDVVVSLRNSSSNASVSLTDLSVQAPPGFSAQGTPNLPATITPGGLFDATLTYSINASLLQPGQNTFTIATTANVGGSQTLSSGIGAISVLGVTGGLAGLQMNITFNPPQIRVGEHTSAEITIAVTNAGGQDLTGISFAGALVQGLLPNNLAAISFSPVPSQTTVQAGGVVAFRGNLVVGPSLASQDYRPAFTMSASQGANTGTVTAQVTNAVQIVQGNNGQGTLPPPGGLVNGSGSGGCALLGADGGLALMFLMLSASIALLMLRRRRLTRG